MIDWIEQVRSPKPAQLHSARARKHRNYAAFAPNELVPPVASGFGSGLNPVAPAPPAPSVGVLLGAGLLLCLLGACSFTRYATIGGVFAIRAATRFPCVPPQRTHG